MSNPDVKAVNYKHKLSFFCNSLWQGFIQLVAISDIVPRKTDFGSRTSAAGESYIRQAQYL